MNGKINEEKGITLAALVITIIVLLILAGVTLNLILRRKWVIKTSTGKQKCT